MKRIGHIVDSITLADIRREAEHAFSTRKYRREAARRFLENFDTEGPRLLRELQSGSWMPEPMAAQDIIEHGKARHIEIPSFRDMVAQRVLCMGPMETALLRHTWPHAFSSIRGRGPLKAARHVARLIARGRPAKWCLYFDVRKYYAHIRRPIVLQDLARIIKDPTALHLLGRIVRMGEQGLAIGNTASHLFANLYLTPMARLAMTHPGTADVVTYMDNVFIFGSSKKNLHRLRRELVRHLAGRGLSIKQDWQVYRTDLRATRIGGFRVQRGRPWRIYGQTFRHLKQAVAAFTDTPTIRHARSVAALQGWTASAHCHQWQHNHIDPIRQPLRKVLRRHDSQSHN